MCLKNSSRLEYVGFVPGNPKAVGEKFTCIENENYTEIFRLERKVMTKELLENKGYMAKQVYYDELNEDQKDFVDLYKIYQKSPEHSLEISDIMFKFIKRLGVERYCDIKHRSAWDNIKTEIDRNHPNYKIEYEKLVESICKYEKQLKEMKLRN